MADPKPSKGFFSEITEFFASVRLALVILITLASTSILGTVLPQGEPLGLYTSRYGSAAGKVIRYFQLDDMYHSWWFQWLLLLLAANLIVCSIKRFSQTWKVITASPRPVNDPLFNSLPFHEKGISGQDPARIRESLRALLQGHFKKIIPLASDSGTVYYGEKGRYSRFGVYLVHLSVLVIFAGAIIGSLFGFKGVLELKEGQSKDHIILRGQNLLKPLDFSVRLDRFGITFYENGLPKEYRSDLTILEGGEAKDKAVIRVNDPFTYKGITFYQSSYDQSPTSLKISIKKGETQSEVLTQMDQRTPIPGTPFALEAVRFVSNLSDLGPALGILLFKDQEEIDHGWVLANHPGFHGNRLGEFRLGIKEIQTQYITGLQVNRDPGIWFIWVGSSLMLLGFIVTFYFSHQQLWIWIREKKDPKGRVKTEVLMGGTAHKNRGAFVLKMDRLFEKIRSTL